MVQISVTSDDLDTIVRALDGADFYLNGTDEWEKKFWKHLDFLKYRLEFTLKKEEKLKELKEKKDHIQYCIVHQRGFTTEEGLSRLDQINDKIFELKREKPAKESSKDGVK